MSFYGRATKDSTTLSPLQQVRVVWLALAAVLVTLSLLFLAYGWRSLDFMYKRAQTQSQSRAELTRSQVFNAFRHMDDVLLQTKSVFERSGPGIASQTSLLTPRPALPGLPPYSCIAIVTAQGDAFFRIPEDCVLPDIAARASELQPLGDSSRLLTDAFKGPRGAQIVRAAHLYYADQTFAGMVLGVLSADYVFSVFGGLDQDSYHLDFELVTPAGPILVAHTGAAAHAGSVGEAETRLEFEGLSGPVGLLIHSSASRTAALDEWWQSVVWAFMGYLLVAGGLVQGAQVLTRALRQQMVSDLVAQRARVESEVQARFIANISHEVRTPMNGVLGAARLLGKTALNESQRQMLGLVERSGKVLLGTINDLLDIGKLREGQMTLEQQPVHLIDLLEDSSALQAPQAHAKGLELVAMLDLPDGLQVLGDALRIQQVVTNLLNNAVKFTSEGVVYFSASLQPASEGTSLRIEVTDTGMGIDLAEADWLFKPFQQADASTARRFGGTGLGLAITDQLVRLMGGMLEVQSQPGKGTTFTALWPLVIAENSSPELKPKTDLVCEIDLPDGDVGRLERKALARHLEHLGVGVMTRQTRMRRRGRASVRGTAPQVVLTDERCLLLERPEWLEQDMVLLVLSREPSSFVLPAHLQGLRWRVIGKPPRRTALAHAFKRAQETGALENSRKAVHAGDAPVAELVAEPVAEPVVEPRIAADVAADLADSSGKPGPLQGLHVLVAEDHTVNQILIRHILEQASCRVQLVSNGLEAVDALFGPHARPDDPYDLVLMDCQMPELDGFNATARIRRRENISPECARLPIIAMTALAMPEDKQRCLDSGMDDYCSKPIDEQTLIEKIVHWTKQRRK